jgi:hypothetical protein
MMTAQALFGSGPISDSCRSKWLPHSITLSALLSSVGGGPAVFTRWCSTQPSKSCAAAHRRAAELYFNDLFTMQAQIS